MITVVTREIWMKFKISNFQLTSVIDGWRISGEIVLWWMSLDLTYHKSTLVEVMAWCCQATRHYLSQYWLSSMSPYGVTRPHWVNDRRNYDERMANFVPIIMPAIGLAPLGAKPFVGSVLTSFLTPEADMMRYCVTRPQRVNNIDCHCLHIWLYFGDGDWILFSWTINCMLLIIVLFYFILFYRKYVGSYMQMNGYLGVLSLLQQINGFMQKRHTVQCHYNAVNFFPNSYKIHPIARLLRRAMGCTLWAQTLIYTLPQSLQWFLQYHIILDCIIRALDCNSIADSLIWSYVSLCIQPLNWVYPACNLFLTGNWFLYIYSPLGSSVLCAIDGI